MNRPFVFAALSAVFLGLSAAATISAQQHNTIVVAQGNPYFLEFASKESKQAGLRVNTTRIGLNAAFSEWLSAAHPAAYRNAVRLSASRPQLSNKEAL